MSIIQLDERRERIESLLLAKKKVLTLEEACDYAGISRSYLYKLTSTGAIPHSKPNGKLIYFERDELERWLLQNKMFSVGNSNQSTWSHSKGSKIS